eukprot:4102481-Prymnesium_polylepis.2
MASVTAASSSEPLVCDDAVDSAVPAGARLAGWQTIVPTSEEMLRKPPDAMAMPARCVARSPL